MSPSNYDKFLGELRLAEINLQPDAIIERDGEVFGLDLRNLTAKEAVKFPYTSPYLHGLHRLKLAKYQMGTYPPIFHLTNLTHLSMNSISGGNLPEQFYNLTNLTCVNIAGNQIEELSPRLGQLSNLRCLALGTNLLVELPDVFDQLPELEYLYLYNNKLRTLPPSIGELDQLGVLVIEENNIKRFPLKIMNLTNLRAFKYNKNPLDLTQGNYLWLDVLEKNGCQTQTIHEETCYRFEIYYWQ